MIGIYGIKNKITNKIYVGQSTQMEKRWKSHIRELKKNNHRNRHLQSSFKIHGEDRFEFFILEECEKSELNMKEEKWIHKFPKELVYNQNLHIVNLRGENNPFYGKKHKKESRKKISESKRRKK